MSKETMLTLCIVALVCGLGWVLVTHQPWLFAVGVIMLMLGLGSLSWRLDW